MTQSGHTGTDFIFFANLVDFQEPFLNERFKAKLCVRKGIHVVLVKALI